MDQRQPRAGAIAITVTEITAVGSSPPLRSLLGAARTDEPARPQLGGPWLVDGHTHAIRGGQMFDDETDSVDAGSHEEALARVTEGRASVSRMSGWRGRVVASEPVHGEAATDRRRSSEASPNQPPLRPVPRPPRARQRGRHRGTRPERLTDTAGARDSRREKMRMARRPAAARRHGLFNMLVASILPVSFEERKDSLENDFSSSERLRVPATSTTARARRLATRYCLP